jgi:hypothetical protein
MSERISSEQKILMRRAQYLVTVKAIKVAKIQGGAQRSNVIVVLYPIVAHNVGKNAVKEREAMIHAILFLRHQYHPHFQMRTLT